MALPSRSYADVLVLAPKGRIDHDNCEAFHADLQPHVDACSASKQAIVFDLSALDYVSSAGLRCFMIAARQGKAQGTRIAVAALQPVVAEIFQISRFNMVFPVFGSLREAIGSVSPAALEAFGRG